MAYLCFSWISSLSNLGKIDWKLTEIVYYFNRHCYICDYKYELYVCDYKYALFGNFL